MNTNLLLPFNSGNYTYNYYTMSCDVTLTGSTSQFSILQCSKSTNTVLSSYTQNNVNYEYINNLLQSNFTIVSQSATYYYTNYNGVFSKTLFTQSSTSDSIILNKNACHAISVDNLYTKNGMYSDSITCSYNIGATQYVRYTNTDSNTYITYIPIINLVLVFQADLATATFNYIKFKNKVPILQMNFNVNIFNDWATATTNQSLISGVSVDNYISSVGLYNDDGQLLVIAKLSNPLKVSKLIDTSIVFQLDKYL